MVLVEWEEFGKGAQKCRGGWINWEKLQELADELEYECSKNI